MMEHSSWMVARYGAIPLLIQRAEEDQEFWIALSSIPLIWIAPVGGLPSSDARYRQPLTDRRALGRSSQPCLQACI